MDMELPPSPSPTPAPPAQAAPRQPPLTVVSAALALAPSPITTAAVPTVPALLRPGSGPCAQFDVAAITKSVLSVYNQQAERIHEAYRVAIDSNTAAFDNALRAILTVLGPGNPHDLHPAPVALGAAASATAGGGGAGAGAGAGAAMAAAPAAAATAASGGGGASASPQMPLVAASALQSLSMVPPSVTAAHPAGSSSHDYYQQQQQQQHPLIAHNLMTPTGRLHGEGPLTAAAVAAGKVKLNADGSIRRKPGPKKGFRHVTPRVYKSHLAPMGVRRFLRGFERYLNLYHISSCTGAKLAPMTVTLRVAEARRMFRHHGVEAPDMATLRRLEELLRPDHVKANMLLDAIAYLEWREQAGGAAEEGAQRLYDGIEEQAAAEAAAVARRAGNRVKGEDEGSAAAGASKRRYGGRTAWKPARDFVDWLKYEDSHEPVSPSSSYIYLDKARELLEKAGCDLATLDTSEDLRGYVLKHRQELEAVVPPIRRPYPRERGAWKKLWEWASGERIWQSEGSYWSGRSKRPATHLERGGIGGGDDASGAQAERGTAGIEIDTDADSDLGSDSGSDNDDSIIVTDEEEGEAGGKGKRKRCAL